jgi:hypothetical protein
MCCTVLPTVSAIFQRCIIKKSRYNTLKIKRFIEMRENSQIQKVIENNHLNGGRQMRGAGGTDGGAGRFFLGLIMMIAGGYLFFNNIHINAGFNSGYAFWYVGGFGITSGMVLIPFILGIGIIFYNGKNPIGWLLALASLTMLGFGVISQMHFQFANMSAFSLITILVLLIGGIGLFLSSLRTSNSRF